MPDHTGSSWSVSGHPPLPEGPPANRLREYLPTDLPVWPLAQLRGGLLPPTDRQRWGWVWWVRPTTAVRGVLPGDSGIPGVSIKLSFHPLMFMLTPPLKSFILMLTRQGRADSQPLHITMYIRVCIGLHRRRESHTIKSVTKSVRTS